MHVSALTLAMPGMTVHEDIEAGRRNLVFDGPIAAPEIHALEHVSVVGICDGAHLFSVNEVRFEKRPQSLARPVQARLDGAG